MNSKRHYHGIGVFNMDGGERVAVFGGQDGEFNYLNSVEFYNAQTQKWKITDVELNEAKYDFGFVTIKSQP